MTNLEKILDDNIRKIPDFPKKGILFYDITSILMNPYCLELIINEMEDYYKNIKIDAVIAAESRGFLFASPFCLNKKLPLILARKKGKLPGETISKTYTLEYGEATIEIHKEDLKKVDNILIIDDLVATGGTLKAIADLVEENGKKVIGIFCVIGLPFLNYNKLLGKYDVKTLINYHSE
ncbi:MAG: adenine phosphoribosyltransferase [Spirochaetes bacterium]|nr:adenine phosphoribosyltransferase [Spirochaetota bacterium]